MGSKLKSSGFTLVELMISLVLGLLVVAGAASLFLSGKSSFNRVEKLAEHQQSVRFVSDSIMMDVRVAKQVVINYPEVEILIPSRTHGSLYCETDDDYKIYYMLDVDDSLKVKKDCNDSVSYSYQEIVSGVRDFRVENVPGGSNRFFLITLDLPSIDERSGGVESYKFHVARRSPIIDM